MKKHALLLFCIQFSLFSYAQIPSVEWYYDVGDMSFGQSAIADIDNDGKLEIVFGTYRNDGQIHAVNAEDGSVLWVYNTGGCMDVAPVIYDVDLDGQLEVIAPGSCVAKTFCINGLTGTLEWQSPTRGSDSPPTIADIDGDDKPEILHGEFTGYVICFNGEDGSQAWEILVDSNCWIQTAPTITDLDNDGNLDFVVANWSFGTNHKIFAYRAHDQFKLWEKGFPNDYMYHGAAVADLDKDGLPELTIGSYDGYVYCLNGEDGSLKWSYTLPGAGFYVGAPTSIGDLDNDNFHEVVIFDSGKVGCLSHDGVLQWSYSWGGYSSSFRGGALSDINGDDTLDIVFGLGDGRLMALSGGGSLIWSLDLENHYGSNFEIDHGPVIADFDNDGILEAFVVGGHAEYPAITNNYGRGYAVSCGPGNGPDWTMFRKDIWRNALVWETSIDIEDQPIEEDLAFTAFPVPSIEVPAFHFNADFRGDLKINIYSTDGRLLYSESVYKNTAVLEFKPGLRKLSQGTYIAEVIANRTKTYKKFIISSP